MLRKRTHRRVVAALLIGLGVATMLLAPESPGGVALLAVGIGLELIGIALERRSR